jgi:pimeloyl-ACP methyl ester carboxylesterase
MGERPPFILVAHSFGALIARLFAYRYPNEIAGLVLIEPAHEDQMERFPEELVASVDLEKMLRMMKPFKYLFSAGIPALRPRLVPLDIPLAQAPLRTAKAVAASSSRAIDAFLSEQESLLESQRQVRAERAKGLGDIPLMVLAHGKPAPVPGGPAITPDVERRYEETWQQLLRETSEMSSRGEYVVGQDSGHYIQLEDPDLVITAIERVVTATRQLEALRTRSD